MKFVFACICMAVSHIAVANELEVGSYVARDAGSYYFSNVKIKNWANKLLLTGYLSYNGGRVPFELTLNETADNPGLEYAGVGHSTVHYTKGMTCQYPMSAKVYPFESGLGFYVESTQQGSICTSNCHECSATNLVHTRHDAPYVRRGD